MNILRFMLTRHSFCQSELGRDDMNIPGTKLLLKILARATEVAARTLVYGASAGPETHGEYLPDCKIKGTGWLTKGKQGAELQERVWVELRERSEGVQRGVTVFE